MAWWQFALLGAGLWWLWPKLFGTPKQSVPTISIGAAVSQAMPQQKIDTSQSAFRSLELVRDRMSVCGATESELDQLIQLAPVLLRQPPKQEATP